MTFTIAKGVGYYHLHTRESYQVILDRIEIKQEKNYNLRVRSIYIRLFFLIISLILLFLIKTVQIVLITIAVLIVSVAMICLIHSYLEYFGRRNRLMNVTILTTFRMRASGPCSVIDFPPELLKDMKKKTSNTDEDTEDFFEFFGDCDYFASDEFSLEDGGAGCG